MQCLVPELMKSHEFLKLLSSLLITHVKYGDNVTATTNMKVGNLFCYHIFISV
jgi:hypothetical protein